MSELRDARLQRALQEAPDAQLRPDARTRGKVLEAARQAVAPAPRPAWWKTLWSAMGNSRAPWNAAFATVVLATLVTVLWYDREIPGPRSDSPRPEQSEPAKPAAPTAAPPVPAPATKAAPSAAPAVRSAEPQRARLQAQSPAGRRDSAPAQSQPGATDTQLASPAAEAKREERSETPAQAAEASRNATPANAPAEPLRDQAPSALAKSRSERAASAPPRAAAAPAPPLAGAPLPGLAGQRAAPGPAADWTGLRISDALGNRVELSREQAPRLAQLASRVARDTQGREPLTDPVDIRIELRRAGELQAVLELAGAQVRWTDASGASFTARPPEAQLRALREEADRLLRR